MRAGQTHVECETFVRKPEALAWIAKREAELKAPGGMFVAKVTDPTLAEVIDRYVATTEASIGRTKAQVLRSIKRYDIARKRCSGIRASDVVNFAETLKSNVQPQTVQNYLSHLSAVFAVAEPAWGYPLDRAAMRDAFAVVKRLGITARSVKRDRRPTLDELDTLLERFSERQEAKADALPMQRLVVFAIFSTRRQEEITRITWADLDEGGSRVMVRDMKNPGQKNGNDVWVNLPPEALAVIRAMPRLKGEPRIFPFHADSVSASFTRACKILGIENLHFHDLRHEGCSRLFEMGWTVPQVATVSGHRNWQSLQRYTHVRQTGDKFAGWPWLSRVTGRQQQSGR
jgi:integrase